MFRSLSRILAEIGGSQRAAKPRRTARLGVEFLENRWVPSTIAGYVFNDAAGNGAFQPGTDPVYASIPISLLNASGAQIASTTTDNAGHYSFTVNQTVNTTPASKEQDVTFGPASTDSSETQQVTQFDPSLGTLTSVEIDMTGNVSSILKLINLDPKTQTPQATIQGTVTLQAPGANALTATDQSIDSGTTLNPGDTFTYSPTNGHGSATVTITDPAALAAYTGTAGNPGTVSIGESGAASISNLSGAANLEALINSTFSGQAKVIYHYTPSNTLTPGQYTVVETQNPPNTTNGTPTSNGVPVPPGTPPDTIPVTLPPGGDSLQNNFPKLTTAKVSGFVYQDNNNNGKFDAGDAPLANASVTISGTPTGGAGPISQTELTTANGSYSFTVPPGNYTITQPNITGYTRGADTVGNLGGTAAPGALTVSLANGDVGTDYNFGEVLPPPVVAPKVSGFVYQDNNKDGQFDAGDAPLPNAVVSITGTPAGGGAAVTQTTLTAADGSYSFTVPPGNYTITQPNITGYTRGADTVGNLGGTAAPGALTVTLASGDVGTDYDFGEVLPPAPPQVNPAKVSGFVYQDNNNNGKFDAGDAALPNAVVTITGTPAGGGAAITQTTLTAADGSYSFNVAPGNYTITQPNITGYTRGADTVGNLGGTASPGALTVTLASGDVGTDYNFGEVLPVPTPVVTPAKVTGFVYVDNNQNGVFDPGDSPIPNAVVSITGTPAAGGAAISLTTLTAADGSYSFSVPPGDYTITQPNITGYTRGADTVGNLGGTASPGALSLSLANGDVGINYNFGEVQNPPTTPQGPPTNPPPTPQTPPPPITKADFFGNNLWMWGW